MIYLEKFFFPDLEHDNLSSLYSDRSFYDEHCYPFQLASEMGLYSLDFEPLTILYGGNGSGKSTVLNVISQKLNARRLSMFNTSPYFDEYVERCKCRLAGRLTLTPPELRKGNPGKYDISNITTVLTSDDIFKAMLDGRQENECKLEKSRVLTRDYHNPDRLPSHINFETGLNVREYVDGVDMRKAIRGRNYSFNKLLLDKVGKMERHFSNGETALMKLSEILEKPGLYLLDEPENSMSCEFQMKLASIISYLARYGDCQFVISSHSPFILSMEGAKIYNLDSYPVDVSRWWELNNMRHYFKLFHDARNHFLKGI